MSEAIDTLLHALGRDEGPALFSYLGTSPFHCLTKNSARINKQWNGGLIRT